MVETKENTRKGGFMWSNEEEPHRPRKAALLAKHGKEINKIMGPEWRTKYLTLLVVGIQLYVAVATKDWDWTWWLATAYVVGGTLNHCLFLAIHEITHNLAFKTPIYNDFLAMIANFPICVPYAMMFKTYHYEHHRYQGWDGVDTDIPTQVEALLFQNFFGKLFFATTQILFYALRPCMIRAQKLTAIHLINWIIVGSFDAAIYYNFGFVPLFYFLVSVFFAGALHPMSGHFISEHYIFDPKEKQETYSYYGPWNYLAWNVGYHNEHHDFPNVSWSQMPKLKKIAPEFYDNLIVTPSWPGTIIRFICDPRVSTWSRMKREKHAGLRTGKLIPTTPETKEVFVGSKKNKKQ